MNYAGFWQRFVALFIDALILFIPGFLIGLSLGGPSYVFFSLSFGLNVISGLILGLIYQAVFESSVMSATPGKAIMGLAVVSEAGERITFKQACVRFFSSYLSKFLCFIGYFMQLFTNKRQTLHDMLSETVVIKRESSADINYFTVWKNQFKEVVAKL